MIERFRRYSIFDLASYYSQSICCQHTDFQMHSDSQPNGAETGMYINYDILRNQSYFCSVCNSVNIILSLQSSDGIGSDPVLFNWIVPLQF